MMQVVTGWHPWQRRRTDGQTAGLLSLVVSGDAGGRRLVRPGDVVIGYHLVDRNCAGQQ